MCGCADECASLCQSQDEGHESDISGVCVCVFAGCGGWGGRPADAVEEKWMAFKRSTDSFQPLTVAP